MGKRWDVIAPKVVIVSMFAPEEGIWHAPASKFDTLAMNITVPGLSPIYPDVHCTADGEVCQFTIGEGTWLQFPFERSMRSSRGQFRHPRAQS
jgi:purine nucleoside permease